VSKILETIAFAPGKFEKELNAFGALLKSNKIDLSETRDIQPFFEKSKQLSAYLGTFSPNIGPATELAFQYPFFGDFRADLVLGNKKEGEFCVVEFEDGRHDSIFKKQPKKGQSRMEFALRARL
jgi:Shedu protein SduA, C-terminal